jgi:predicted enzyme related to lactoylglutathione lyase
MANSINWFEIPSKNFERACSFYGAILDGDVHITDMGSGIDIREIAFKKVYLIVLKGV